jgi:hypothetical protein
MDKKSFITLDPALSPVGVAVAGHEPTTLGWRVKCSTPVLLQLGNEHTWH